MYRRQCLFLFVVLLTVPSLTSLVKNTLSTCRLDEYSCEDGTCVKLNALCDGRQDCLDGSDERVCDGVSYPQSKSNLLLNRSKRRKSTCREDQIRCKNGDCVHKKEECNKFHCFNGAVDCTPARSEFLPIDYFNFSHHMRKRQATTCRKNQWQCRDGTCIGFDGKCDGVMDCPDGSDETFPLCRTMKCQSNWFRCTYGACVDGTAPCNGIQECADSSDELLPRCRNETEEVRGQFKCKNGQVIAAAEHCDGVRDCADGSDETIEACAAKTCPSYLFQCAYGACVDQGSDCNEKQECADGSDESDELCNKISSGDKPTPMPKPVQGGQCRLPPYPKYGTYVVSNNPNAVPGQTFSSVHLKISCNAGLGVEDNKDSIWCYNGLWSESMPKCVGFCRLNKHPSVEYRCLSKGAVTGSRECGNLEPAGTVVQPICRSPNYYYPGVLSNMNCQNGYWDYIAQCKPGLTLGTNITISVNNVEIHISSNSLNRVVVNNFAQTNNVKIHGNGLVSQNNATNKEEDSDPNSFNISIVTKDPKESVAAENNYNEYNIDEGDWRMAQAQVVKPKTDKNNENIHFIETG